MSGFQCCCFLLPVGFRRKEFRGKLAIAITANFINRNTTAEAKVEEISGVAFIFNQKFFQDLRDATGLPALDRFPVKTVCLYYYNFAAWICMFNQERTSCARQSVIAVSEIYFPVFAAVLLYEADVCHFGSEVENLLRVFRKSEP